MRIKINTAIIEKLNPCKYRLNNWIEHYSDFNGDILEFLSLNKITASDKVWVSIRLMPKSLIDVFVIDCAISAAINTVNYDHAACAANNAAYATTAEVYSIAFLLLRLLIMLLMLLVSVLLLLERIKLTQLLI